MRNVLLVFLLLLISDVATSALTLEKVNSLVGNENVIETPQSAPTTRALIEDFFATSGCFSASINKDIQKTLKKKGVSGIPTDVLEGVNDYANLKPKKTLNFSGLHSLIYTYAYRFDEDSDSILRNADTFSTRAINPLVLLDTSEDPLFFTLDCSGYLSVLASAEAGLSKALVKAASKGEASYKRTMLMVVGRIVPVLNVAIDPEGTLSLPTNDEVVLSLLSALLHNMYEDGDKVNVVIPESYTVVSFEKSTTTKLQGEVDMEMSGSLSYGLGGVSTQTGSGAAILQRLSFTDYETSIISVGPGRSYTIDKIRNRFSDLLKRVEIDLKPQVDSVEIHSYLTKSLCEEGRWLVNILKSDGTMLRESHTIESKYNDNKCFMSFDFPRAWRTTSEAYELVVYPTQEKYLGWRNANGSPRLRNILMK